jgi:hypothetical protein
MSKKTETKGYEKFIKQCVSFCKTANMKTKEEVFKWMNGELQKDYEGKAPKWKIESVAEDVTESICLKMGISC